MAKARKQPEPRAQFPSSLSGRVNVILVVLVLRVLFAAAVQFLPATTFAFTVPVTRLPFIGSLAVALGTVLLADPFGATLDLLLFAVAYYFCLDVVARIVLPALAPDRGRVRQLVKGAQARTLPYPVIVASNGTFEVRGARPSEAVGPAAVLCDGLTVLALEEATGRRRVVGPGLNWLEPYERVEAAVDLRPIQMQRTATGTTREGMLVEVDIAITVEIARDKKRNADDPKYPFNPGAVLKALYCERAQAIDSTDTRPAADWREITGWQVEDGMRRVIAAYTVDQLFAVDRPDVNPRRDMENSLLRIVNPEITPYGATCTEARIIAIRPPRAVLEQRIRMWCSEWNAREQAVLALGKAQEEQAKESARTSAQHDVFQNLIGALRVPADQATVEVVSRRMAEALDRMAREPETGALLDVEVRQALDRVIDVTRERPDLGETP